MCKRYVIEARRNANEEWSTWTETDDLYSIQKHYDRVKELGYEVRAIDPKIAEWEQKVKDGSLLFTPVRVGQLVWAVLYNALTKKHYVEEWVVKTISYDGKKWYAGNENGVMFEVRTQDCFLFKGKANRLMRKLNGESDDEVAEDDEG